MKFHCSGETGRNLEKVTEDVEGGALSERKCKVKFNYPVFVSKCEEKIKAQIDRKLCQHPDSVQGVTSSGKYNFSAVC